MKKIFVIGFQKTGTSSLSKALNLLGISCLHTPTSLICDDWFPHGAPEHKKLDFSLTKFENRLHSVLQRYDALADNPIALEEFFPTLLNNYSDAYYIYNYRHPKNWLNSAFYHINSSHYYNIHLKRLNTYKNYSPNKDLSLSSDPLGLDEYIYGFSYPKLSNARLLSRYLSHQKNVRAYFRDSRNFLDLDISQDNAWKKLCNFLEIQAPQDKFPHSNSRKRSLKLLLKTNYRSIRKNFFLDKKLTCLFGFFQALLEFINVLFT